MTEKHEDPVSFDDFDDINYPRPDRTDFDRITEVLMSRRDFMKSTLAFGSAAFIMGTSTSEPAKSGIPDGFGFQAIPSNTLDTITVPEGYKWDILIKWGDPLWSKGMEFDQKTRGTGESQELAFGDNNDGMAIFEKDGTTLLVANNEYTNLLTIYGNRPGSVPMNADDVRKGKAAHGVSVCEIQKINGRWVVVKDSPYNRRITADTAMNLTGPARGHDLVKTAADTQGILSLGTWNNCGNGITPWGTYLACEENFNSYFSCNDPAYQPDAAMKRYGIGLKDWGYGWAGSDERFDISKHPNEPNRAGYVVEINPWDPSATPRKRTALGRFKHENAELVISREGYAVVYMGDDEKGEYLYRFVSRDKFNPDGDNTALLDHGALYVARFNTDQTGSWLKLDPQTTGMAGEAEICIYTRLAASKVGATTMDRPEWVAVHPDKPEVYCTLTNNKDRGIAPNAGGDATPAEGPNPRRKNIYGQIVRWKPDGGDHASDRFTWDLYVTAGNPEVHRDAYAGSGNINADNMFNSPDGLHFAPNGTLWIQTDGNYSDKGDFKGMGNNQMLAANPETGEIRRFLVGPREAEITGLCWSTDRQTMFVGIQHPGEKGNSHFPDLGDTAPRSCIISITRNDGKPLV